MHVAEGIAYCLLVLSLLRNENNLQNLYDVDQ